ncbi:cytochrome P450 [Chondromyces apiculatus]|uniref:Putative cytochrome P450 hydroxylase n=1 Tax=Chondromyces apiculatus DSM 436 TaxID=1192034 RepID=A0A017TA56_9BACT|nr:cytochrome P450 [Chondromyces apiculatus]EYF06094.1 putative cytochrome P450 hydroxylase [Chondromyces apiculatus DSM 436]
MTSRIDILSPVVRADPYPHYAELRRRGPVCEVDPGGMWAVSRHEEVLRVLKSPAIFSSQGFQRAWEPPWLGYNPLARSLLATDPPRHARLRARLHRVFAGSTLSRMEPRLRAFAEGLAARLAGEVDVVAAYAAPVPAFVIAELLGLDQALAPRFERWADDLLSVTPEPESAAHVARVRGSMAELCDYLGEVVAARRRVPADDVVGGLLSAGAGGDGDGDGDGDSAARLSDAEAIEMLVVLLFGGLETTTHFLANTLLFLADHPEELSRLRERPERIPAFLEEMNRYDGPTQSVPRIVVEEVSLGGVTLPAGALVLALVGSANRDEVRFVDADRFDPERGQSGLGFGHGIHFCAGAALARLEARVALEVLVARFGRIERVPGALRYNRTLTVRGPVALPLRLLSS